jgi:hypothetical protein
VIAAALVVGSACSKVEPAGGDGGSAGDGGGAGTGGADAADTDANVDCGATRCDPVPPSIERLGVASCCAAANQCGLSIVTSCIAPDQPGGLDPSCPDVTLPGTTTTLRGCCGADSRCGALDTFMGLGCIAGADLGEADAECVYDPNNDCVALTPLPCDGPEDCENGQVCCGKLVEGSFTEFACHDDCEEADPMRASLWLELCHPGQQCKTFGLECLTSQALPEFLFRCYTEGSEPASAGSTAEGEINCGPELCKGGETCCLRALQPPYCAPERESCRCNPVSVDGGSDAGTDAESDVTSDTAIDAPEAGSTDSSVD